MRNEKGQGLTEYVLLLAFIAAIAFMLNSGGLLGTVKGSYNETQGIFAMLFGDNSRPDWGHADISTFNESNSAERLARDQEALVNLANYFIGKKKKDDLIKVRDNYGDVLSDAEKRQLTTIISAYDKDYEYYEDCLKSSYTWGQLKSVSKAINNATKK